MNFGEITPEIMQHYKFWARVADYYDKQCTKAALAMYAQQVSRFSVDDLIKAFQQYSGDARNKFMPLPAQLIEILDPRIDPDSEAKLIAGRVVAAVAAHGWPNSSKAKADIGPAGWSAVEAYGGWSYICENLGVNISMGQFQAQIRDHARAQIELGASRYNENQLEHQGNDKLGSMVRQLAEQREMK